MEIWQKIIFFYVFSSNNQKYIIYDQDILLVYQFDIVDFIPDVFGDIQDDLGVSERRKMKNFVRNVKIVVQKS